MELMLSHRWSMQVKLNYIKFCHSGTTAISLFSFAYYYRKTNKYIRNRPSFDQKRPEDTRKIVTAETHVKQVVLDARNLHWYFALPTVSRTGWNS